MPTRTDDGQTVMSEREIKKAQKAIEDLTKSLGIAVSRITDAYDQADQAQKQFTTNSIINRQKNIQAEKELQKVIQDTESTDAQRHEAQQKYLKETKQHLQEEKEAFETSQQSINKQIQESSDSRIAALERERQISIKRRREELNQNKERNQDNKEYLEQLSQLNALEKESKQRQKNASRRANQQAFYEGGLEGLQELKSDEARERNKERAQAHDDYLAARDAARANPDDPVAKEQLRIAKENLKEAQKQSVLANAQLKAAQLSNKLVETMDKSIEETMNLVSQYQPKLNARLQGTDKTFNDISKTLKNNLTLSPFVQVGKVMENIEKLSSQGIAYNLEQRAFLASIAEDIASTFDAANGTLLRLIRIQQQDSTTARMGMEASLTKLLNSMFNDTSYLGGLSDAVKEALIEAESIRSKNESLEFEYTVQKWLGALSALGMSQSGVQSVATAIGQLASGNVQQLVGTPMMTLLAMGAQKSGVDLSGITTGFSTQEIDEILSGLVATLQSAKSGSAGPIILNALASVFGLTPSDLMSVSNLTSNEISSILSSSLSYSSAENELVYQFSQLPQRLSLKTMLDNIMKNVTYSMGETIGTNPILYGIYKGADFMKGITGGIHLPAISVMGNAVDLSAFTVEDLIKTGVMGISAVGSLLSAVSSLGNAGGLSLSGWGAKPINERGGVPALIVTGVGGGVSQSAYVASGSGKDTEKQAVFEGSKNESVQALNEENEPEHTFDEFYKNVVEKDSAVKVVFDENAMPTLSVYIKECDDVLRLADTTKDKTKGNKEIVDKLEGIDEEAKIISEYLSGEDRSEKFDALDRLNALASPSAFLSDLSSMFNI